MKNLKYILSVFMIVIIISYFLSSCNSFLGKELNMENMQGKVFKNDNGSKLIFKKDKIYYYFDDQNIIITNYKQEVDNMIFFNIDGMEFEGNEFRIYLLKDNSIYFTLDNDFYYAK